MPLRLTLFIIIIALAFCSGCVKKSIYEKSQSDLNLSRSSWQRCKADLDGCSGKLEECEKDKTDAQSALDALGQMHESLNREHSSLGKEYTQLKDLLDRINKSNAKRRQAMDELLGKFGELIKSGRLTVAVNDGRMVIQLPSSVLFKSGQSQLSPAGKKAVIEVAGILTTIDNRKFQVAGHTDNQRASRGLNPNWSLSYNRARSVFDVLVRSGVTEDRLSIAAWAEYSPVADNRTMEGRESNRRIEIVLLPTSEELPLNQLMQLEKIEKID